jgi:pimeloyl-ACP methyl ester carboxylesterase
MGMAEEIRLRANGGSFVGDAFPPEELAVYRAAFASPRAVAPALGYYRAAPRGVAALARAGRSRPIAAPTLVVWGARDRFLGRETIDLARTSRWLAPGNAPEVVFLEEAGHFVQNEAPDRVNREILGWLRRHA